MRSAAGSSLGLALPLGVAVSLSAMLVTTHGRAADPTITPRVMMEPGDVVDVADAFDDDAGDPFDATISLGFTYLSKRARILRESTVFEPGLTTGGFTSKLSNVGEYVETTSILTPRLDIGLYKDLALYGYVPVWLDNSRRINGVGGTEDRENVVLAGAPGEVLFDLPFTGPDRSGVRYVGVGFDWGIFNQARDRTKPTWVFGTEIRISAGDPMHPCNAAPASGEISCAHEGDIDRDGQNDNDPNGDSFESNAIAERGPGITTGTFGWEIHTIVSKRIKYIEPYGGLTALLQFQQDEDTLYGATDLEGALVNHPPMVGTVLVGMMIHPWENREAFGRLSFDLRFQGEYHSEGRDYSELFDALGSSNVPSLRNPKWARFTDCAGADCGNVDSVVDEGSEKTYFTGLTVVEAYGSYRASGSATWRAGEYVKLNAGLGLRFDQAHGISHDQPCNPDLTDDAGRAGPCTNQTQGVVTGVPNPAHRRPINEVGRRFYVDESITYEVFASGTVMF